jgi:polyphosphate kinase 2
MLGRREARAFDEVDHRSGDALELLAGLARGGQVAAARAAALAAFHEGKVERPPGQADHRHPDQLLLEEELQERDAAVEDALQHQDVHPALVVAPNNREKTQWYFQRYVAHLPAAGEIVLFDRSWYNRAGVEAVMGFCSDDELEEFFRSAPEFEKMLVRSGIRIIKYWFSVSDDEQEARFLGRIHDPLKQWKLSPMDLESRRRWEDYTRAKEVMLERTHIPEAPWWVVQAVDKKRSRLNCIAHLLGQFDYHEIEHPAVELPPRERGEDYIRRPVPDSMYVPDVY